MERLLLNYFDLNDLKGFEAAFARDRTNHPGLYRSSPDLTGRIFSELARRYAETGQINEAARIYKLEMESYPDSEVNSRLRRNCLVNLEKISRSRSEIRQMQIYRDQILAIDKLQKNQRVK